MRNCCQWVCRFFQSKKPEDQKSTYGSTDEETYRDIEQHWEENIRQGKEEGKYDTPPSNPVKQPHFSPSSEKTRSEP